MNPVRLSLLVIALAVVQLSLCQDANKIKYMLRVQGQYNLGFSKIGENPLYYNDVDDQIYGLSIINSIQKNHSNLGIGLGISQWESTSVDLYANYMHAFNFPEEASWFHLFFNAGFSFGEINHESPYKEYRSNTIYYFDIGPLAKIEVAYPYYLSLGICYRWQKQLLLQEYRDKSVEHINFIGFSVGFAYR